MGAQKTLHCVSALHYSALPLSTADLYSCPQLPLRSAFSGLAPPHPQTCGLRVHYMRINKYMPGKDGTEKELGKFLGHLNAADPQRPTDVVVVNFGLHHMVAWNERILGVCQRGSLPPLPPARCPRNALPFRLDLNFLGPNEMRYQLLVPN